MIHTVTSPAGLPPIIAAMLGFEPTNSLVILPIGSGRAPTARIDLDPTVDPDSLHDVFAPARRYWSQVAVVLYTDDQNLAEHFGDSIERILPGVTVDIVCRVAHGHIATLDGSRSWAIDSHTGNQEIDARVVHPSRDDLARDAETITEARAALTMAIHAYKAGNGARALTYLDRCHALQPDDDTTRLARLLEVAIAHAVDPNEIDGSD